MDSLNPYNPFKNKNKNAHYNQEQLDYIKQLLDSGWSVSKIHNEYGISKDSIKKRIKANDWKASGGGYKFTQQDLDDIKCDIENGISIKDIALKYKVSEYTLMRRKINNNWTLKKCKNRYTFDENYFDVINNEHKAYWLGFLMADGYILSARHRKSSPNKSQSFGFAVNTKDMELFDYFKKDLNATNPVNIYKNTSNGFKNDSSYGRILLTSQHTVDALKNHGLVENKTFICKMPDISNELIPHFIRGYSDGDGSISHDKNNRLSWGICGTKELLISFQKFLGTNYKLSQRWPERNNNNWSLEISGWNNVPRLLDIIYKDATIYLKRKYDKYVEIQGCIE